MPEITREQLAEKNKSVVQKLNNNVALPTDAYYVRVKKASFSISKSSGNPMVTVVTELVHPKTIEVGGAKYAIAGVELKPNYYPLDNAGDSAKATASQQRWLEFREKCGLPADSINTENPIHLDVEGLIIYAKCGDDTVEQRKAPKPGQAVGDLILDPTGKPYPAKHYPKVIEFYGVSELPAGESPSSGV